MKQNLILLTAIFALLVVPSISLSESGSAAFDVNEFAFNAKLLPSNPVSIDWFSGAMWQSAEIRR